MDGTASLIYLLAAKEAESNVGVALRGTGETVTTNKNEYSENVVIRGDSTKKQVALVFTGDEFGDGLSTIQKTLAKEKINGSFFFTGRFYRNREFQENIRQLYAQHNLMGSHSDMHLLYNDWTNRNRTFVTKDSLLRDLNDSKQAILDAGIGKKDMTPYFIPPYEWWNKETAYWLQEAGMRVFSFTPGTTSNADYTYPELGKSYRTSEEIIANIKKFNETRKNGMNGVILLIHAGTDPRRKDKLYDRLEELIGYLKQQGYGFKKVNEMF